MLLDFKKWKRSLPNTFYEVSVVMMPKLGKHKRKKKELCQPISLVSIDAKYLISATQIQQHIKKSIHHDLVEIIHGFRNCTIHANKYHTRNQHNEGQKSYNHLNRCRKGICYSSTFLNNKEIINRGKRQPTE